MDDDLCGPGGFEQNVNETCRRNGERVLDCLDNKVVRTSKAGRPRSSVSARTSRSVSRQKTTVPIAADAPEHPDTLPQRVFWKDRNFSYFGDCKQGPSRWNAGLRDPAGIMASTMTSSLGENRLNHTEL